MLTTLKKKGSGPDNQSSLKNYDNTLLGLPPPNEKRYLASTIVLRYHSLLGDDRDS